MKKHLYTLVFGLIFCVSATGQNELTPSPYFEDNQFLVSWDIAFPMGDYLDETSFSGFRFEYRKFIDKNWAWGISTGWNSYSQKLDQQLYQTPDGGQAIFTDMIRTVFELPITVNGYYFLDQIGKFKPYAGLGLGTLYSRQEAFFNIYIIEENNWGFLARPEVGFNYELEYSMGLQAYAAYSYATNKNDGLGIDSLQHISFGVGAYWSY
jgi:opacity protein-like surface antigen